MPANVETMFSVRERPWHGEGQIIDHHPETWEEIRTLGGFEWDISEEPVYERSGMNSSGEPAYSAIPGYKRVTRDDTGETLAVHNATWQVINHQAMGEVANAVLGQGGVKGETGGVLAGGRKVWALFQLGDPWQTPGDVSETFPYLALLNAHDGSSAFQAIPTTVRVVCQNTWHLSELTAQRQGVGFSIRHTKNWADQLEEARQAIRGAEAQTQEVRELHEHLAALKVTPAQEEEFIQMFMPLPAADIITLKVRRNVEEARDKMRLILSSPTCEDIRGTANSLVQAAGEYADHFRGYRNRDSYTNRTLLSHEKLKVNAVSRVRELLALAA